MLNLSNGFRNWVQCSVSANSLTANPIPTQHQTQLHYKQSPRQYSAEPLQKYPSTSSSIAPQIAETRSAHITRESNPRHSGSSALPSSSRL